MRVSLLLGALIAICAGHNTPRRGLDKARAGRWLEGRAESGDRFAADLARRRRRQLPEVVLPVPVESVVGDAVAGADSLVTSLVANAVGASASASLNGTVSNSTSTGKHSRTKTTHLHAPTHSQTHSHNATSTRTTSNASRSHRGSKTVVPATASALKSGQSYSATVLPNGKTSLVIVTPSAVVVTAAADAAAASDSYWGSYGSSTSTNLVVVTAGQAQAGVIASVPGAASPGAFASSASMLVALVAILGALVL